MMQKGKYLYVFTLEYLVVMREEKVSESSSNNIHRSMVGFQLKVQGEAE